MTFVQRTVKACLQFSQTCAFGDPEAKAIVNEIVVGGSEKSLQINVSFAVKMLKGKKMHVKLIL